MGDGCCLARSVACLRRRFASRRSCSRHTQGRSAKLTVVNRPAGSKAPLALWSCLRLLLFLRERERGGSGFEPLPPLILLVALLVVGVAVVVRVGVVRVAGRFLGGQRDGRSAVGLAAAIRRHRQTVASSSCGPLTLTWNPAASKMLFASASVELATNGTLTCCLPVDTQMVTAVPASTVLPEPGSMRVTAPDCTESEYSLSMVICVRPACLSCAMTESLAWLLDHPESWSYRTKYTA